MYANVDDTARIYDTTGSEMGHLLQACFMSSSSKPFFKFSTRWEQENLYACAYTYVSVMHGSNHTGEEVNIVLNNLTAGTHTVASDVL